MVLFDGSLTARTQGRAQAAMRELLAGGRAPRALPTGDDTGFCGPGSVSWERVDDPATIVAGIRALLMQLANPAVAQGVVDHTTADTDPLGRLARTVDYMSTTTFGTRAEVSAMIPRVVAVHERVRGRLPSGARYCANDPDLLSWVHVSLMDSLIVCWDRLGAAPVAAVDAERLLGEHAPMAAMLGVHSPPGTRAELDAEMVRLGKALTTVPATLDAVRMLRCPPIRLALRPAYRILFGAAVALLPVRQCRMLGLGEPKRYAAELRLARTILAWWRRAMPAPDRGPACELPAPSAA